MARPRSGLGHGLEALVSPRDWSQSQSANPDDKVETARSAPVPVVRWEFATIERSGRKGRSLLLTTLRRRVPGALRRRRLRGIGLLAALNGLGRDGWELTAIDGGRFYLKRPVKLS